MYISQISIPLILLILKQLLINYVNRKWYFLQLVEGNSVLF